MKFLTLAETMMPPPPPQKKKFGYLDWAQTSNPLTKVWTFWCQMFECAKSISEKILMNQKIEEVGLLVGDPIVFMI